jgi:hypothetical protein
MERGAGTDANRAVNVFVLNTGRCGSVTFIEACRHIRNYSAAHESRVTQIGEQRLAYAANHIEADNRLCWFLGRLDRAYGDSAFYVHLRRDIDATAASFVKRRDFGIMKAWREGILLGGQPEQSDSAIALDYIDSVEANIEHFLRDKSRHITVRLENAKADFTAFWHRIGAEGDLDRALAAWDTIHNASE